jgi:hypothetical protein
MVADDQWYSDFIVEYRNRNDFGYRSIKNTLNRTKGAQI